ncbi:hypothetical protein, partial [Kitasatospora sp. SUK 42]|uniref:hypothetical protein n=1 Tax=Kitasatospora sp. SUK 42 TaxID=1588882 RepID=UPI001C31CBCD
MVRPLLVIPLFAAALGGIWLSRGALQRWRDLCAAETYELAGERWPMLVRAVGAMICGVCVTVLTMLSGLGAFGGFSPDSQPTHRAADPSEVGTRSGPGVGSAGGAAAAAAA